MPTNGTPTIRTYHPDDERSWLRCRTLSFLETCYYDDVWITKPREPVIELVAVDGDQVIGILDVEIDGDLATIDTIAIHPDHQRRGIGTALLESALPALPAAVTTLDAWTREDTQALAWYRTRGFTESEHYLHVYKGYFEPTEGWDAPEPLHPPVMAFAHARLEDEDELRERFARVYVCRRFSRPCCGPAGAGR